MESALRALESLAVDIAFLTETKLTGGIHTRNFRGYQVVATEAVSAKQGGIALCYRGGEHFEVEETSKWGPNVISCHVVTGKERLYVVGCYIPPSDLKALQQVQAALAQCPKDYKPLLLGNLNINLEFPRNERDEEIAEECEFHDFADMSRQFCQVRRRRTQGRWTWRMRREGRWVSSQPDCVLARKGDRGLFQNVSIKRPRHHDSDHRAVVATIYAGSSRQIRGYRKRRGRFPVRLQRVGPRTAT